MREKSAVPETPPYSAHPVEGDAVRQNPEQSEDSLAGADAAEPPALKNLLSEHKGKLAIGVAATLGIMIYYNWRQKRLPKEDPEAYARLKRIREHIKSHGEPPLADKKDETQNPSTDAQTMAP